MKTIRNKREKKTNKTRKKRIYTNIEYNSKDGMLTSVWGPSMWHVLHTISFNYPVKPSNEQKKTLSGFYY